MSDGKRVKYLKEVVELFAIHVVVVIIVGVIASRAGHELQTRKLLDLIRDATKSDANGTTPKLDDAAIKKLLNQLDYGQFLLQNFLG